MRCPLRIQVRQMASVKVAQQGGPEAAGGARVKNG
jgi:hypothetical protein